MCPYESNIFKQMKSGFSGLTPVQLTGLLLGIFGLILPFLIPLGSLSFAGQIGLGIFIMAAIFWMFEPIPIYATSMLVIFLQIVLLSAQGPMFMDAKLPTGEPVELHENTWQIPTRALKDDNTVLLAVEPGKTKAVQVEIVERNGQHVIVRSVQLSADKAIVSDTGHRLVGYKPNSYTDYLGTLANPIIILFLGGFMLAEASVKYNLDKNLTRYLLSPFGSKPRFIILGLMLVTAALSAFMSNTATAAMMVTVILPHCRQYRRYHHAHWHTAQCHCHSRANRVRKVHIVYRLDHCGRTACDRHASVRMVAAAYLLPAERGPVQP
jgi:solute carrier family 13 (sodium-dependent dicarboxylate transporter), member 2/3/5